MKDVMGLLLILFLIAIVGYAMDADADSIACYTKNKIVYYPHVIDITYTGDIFIFTEQTSGRIILSSAECIAKIDA
jgi:hypothetical protein